MMTRFINLIAPFLPDKVAIINSILSTMPDSTKEIILDRVVAKNLPDMHIKYRPYKVNPKKKDTSYKYETDKANKYIDK